MKFFLLLSLILLPLLTSSSFLENPPPSQGRAGPAKTQESKTHHAKKTSSHVQWSLPQLPIINYLNHKSVSVLVKSGTKKFSFFSFLSRNSRGLLFDVTSQLDEAKDKTGFLHDVALRVSENAIDQFLVDFRLIELCAFRNSILNRTEFPAFTFTVFARDSNQEYKVRVKFHNAARQELLVNDVEEFKNILIQLTRACRTRKNQLRNRKVNFGNRAEILFSHHSRLEHGIQNRETFFGEKNPLNIDKQINKIVDNQKKTTSAFLKAKGKAGEAKGHVVDLEAALEQAKKDITEIGKQIEALQFERRKKKLELDRLRENFDLTKKNLIRLVPFEKKRIVKSANLAGEKGHEADLIELKLKV